MLDQAALSGGSTQLGKIHHKGKGILKPSVDGGQKVGLLSLLLGCSFMRAALSCTLS